MGRAFGNSRAQEELRTIASLPSDDHVFRVDNFEALGKIRENLQNKIFSIEGSGVFLSKHIFLTETLLLKYRDVYFVFFFLLITSLISSRMIARYEYLPLRL